MIKRNRKSAAPARSRWRTYFLITTCGLLTVTGFFLAGRQHFSWMDYGMKNSRLRKQIDDLQAEKRRLLLAREVSLSPGEIKKAAKKVGLGDTAEVSSATAQLTASVKKPDTPAAAAVPVSQASSAAKPMVVKTVAVTPAASASATANKKADRPRMIAKLNAE